MSSHPYQARYEVHRFLPEKGRPQAEVIDELRTIAREEDTFGRPESAPARCIAATTSTMSSYTRRSASSRT